MRNTPLKAFASPAKSRFGAGDGEETKKVLKQVNPVIQGAKLVKNISKATVKGLKERPKKNPSHVGVRKILYEKCLQLCCKAKRRKI